MVRACDRIRNYVGEMDKAAFLQDSRTYDAVVRNLEIVGEAAKHLPRSIREQIPAVPFQLIGEMRNILAHAYFGIDDDILWDVIINHAPQLRQEVAKFLSQSSQQ
jgi:uncharacterized protein with HEPN domain